MRPIGAAYMRHAPLHHVCAGYAWYYRVCVRCAERVHAVCVPVCNQHTGWQCLRYVRTRHALLMSSSCEKKRMCIRYSGNTPRAPCMHRVHQVFIRAARQVRIGKSVTRALYTKQSIYMTWLLITAALG